MHPGARPSNRTDRLVGWILFVGSLQFVVEMAVEELLLPWYNIVQNAISDLGGRNAGGLGIFFDASVFGVGLAAAVSALLLWSRLPRSRSLRVGEVFLLVAGIGAMIVGLYPEYTHAPHAIGAVLAFLFGNLGLMALGRGFRKTGEELWFARFSSLCGLFGMLSIVVAILAGVFIAQGVFGITERMIVAPILLWAIVYGLRRMRGTFPSADAKPLPAGPPTGA